MQKNKTIAFYCSSTSWGGLEMNMARYALWMEERGWKCIVFCVDNTPLEQKSVALGLKVIQVRKNGKYLDIINAFRVKKLFAQHHITHAWFSDNRDMSLLGIVKKLLGNKLFLFYRQAMRLGIDKKDILHTIRFNRIDAWVATLPYMAQEVLDKTKLDPSKLHHAPLGIDQARFIHPQLSKSEAKSFFNINDKQRVTIGIIGRIDPLKGQLFVLESFIKLINHGLDVQLLIVGESTLNEGVDYEELIRQRIHEAMVSDRIYLHPYIEQTENFYQAIDIFVMASEGETFGMVTIEAMAAGCAIIGTDSAGTPELLGQGKFGLLYEYNNTEDFCKQVKTYYECPEKLISYGTKAQQQASQWYSKTNSCEQYEKILNKNE